MTASTLYIGWDVGGWNCDHNPASRDALVVLDDALHVIGKPWRGNLRETLNEATSSRDVIHRLLALCQHVTSGDERVVMAIDTPLALPQALLALARGEAVDRLGRSQENPYLYRETERWLFARGITPLSPIKDMIGSQATKGMHFLARFAPHVAACGQWQSKGGELCVVEGYPSPAKRSAEFAALRRRVCMTEGLHAMLHQPTPKQQDIQDAWHCALLAWSLEHAKGSVAWPPAEMPAAEGWIFVPKDALSA
ncbi:MULTISPECIES: DUF429 domain-containing protein [unclassified Halomonas]|uniref:DUF429 domain-containing protein n=1 Tax=unclassified Halomonas TaxID=2609666 RepID=UPI001EF47387|nr:MULTISPECIES: DUF429 domain-containing protein [unclassified Halomonas]MCG7578135.1 DUF429 domain-containing protein [Halomonas sp. MMH1-48]MCG7605191.1 DUF429 domain-containing protein [Halomonas sp. MM17-34]MCG7614407.1 DUF429 domain-containing protein [Halomonas sp. MM17-29]MCG7621310.1 DUF429 domain-containing protein [Halomonas sp. DSH1-27]